MIFCSTDFYFYICNVNILQTSDVDDAYISMNKVWCVIYYNDSEMM